MKLDTRDLRYLTPEDWRVLTAVELGSKTHFLVPTSLIISLSHLRSGNTQGQVQRSISILAKANLISKVRNAKYDGYRLTYGGLDYLALHGHIQKGFMEGLGPRVAVGKESDIYTVLGSTPLKEEATSDLLAPAVLPSSKRSSHHHSARKPKKPRAVPPTQPSSRNKTQSSSNNRPPTQLILKIHRLGRISFRSIKTNRAYTTTSSRNNPTANCQKQSFQSWLHISRLSATKEFLFQSALHAAGFPVPYPIAQNRHTILMSLIDAPRLQQVKHVADDSVTAIAALYSDLMSLILRLASVGVIHGDFNEFNILIHTSSHPSSSTSASTQQSSSPPSSPPSSSSPSRSSNKSSKITPCIIDFPQLLSLSHPNAESYFLRDVNCIKSFFHRRFGFTSNASGPEFKDALRAVESTRWEDRLDVKVEAAGFTRKMGRELEGWVLGDRREERQDAGGGEGSGSDGDSDEDDELSEEEVDDENSEHDEALLRRAQSPDAVDYQKDEEQMALPHHQIPPISSLTLEAANE